MNVAEINRTIIAGQFSNDELNTIVDAIKFARSQLIHKNTGSMVIGTRVKFTNNRNGQVIVGKVEKVNRKFIMVREQTNSGFGALVWKVPASMLAIA